MSRVASVTSMDMSPRRSKTGWNRTIKGSVIKKEEKDDAEEYQ